MSAQAEENGLSRLEQEAVKRKERLKALKRKAESASNTESDGSVDESIKPVFRSYKPQDETIADSTSDEPILGDLESEVKSQLEMMKTPIVIEEIDIANLAPRKPDWDLKRDVSKKLEKLERRTQKAIAELIRDRLKMDQDNILEVVNVGSALNAKTGYEE